MVTTPPVRSTARRCFRAHRWTPTPIACVLLLFCTAILQYVLLFVGIEGRALVVVQLHAEGVGDGDDAAGPEHRAPLLQGVCACEGQGGS